MGEGTGGGELEDLYPSLPLGGISRLRDPAFLVLCCGVGPYSLVYAKRSGTSSSPPVGRGNSKILFSRQLPERTPLSEFFSQFDGVLPAMGDPIIV